MTKEEFLIRKKNMKTYSPGWQGIDDAFEKALSRANPRPFWDNSDFKSDDGRR